jgi:putative endonuclease
MVGSTARREQRAEAGTPRGRARRQRDVRAFVYVLGCRTSRGALTYVGWTLDPDRRLAEHNNGTGAKSTRGRIWAIIHREEFQNRREAMRREWHLKRDRRLRRRLLETWLGNTGADP